MAVAGQPSLRGVSHQFACLVALGAGAMLIVMAGSGRAVVGAAIYAATLAGMLGTSACYHRIRWRPAAQRRWQRADHAMIFVFIAGTYTPICLLGVGGDAGARLLAIVWTGALAGAATAMWWARAPRFVTVGLYLVLGWAMIAEWPAVHAALSTAALVLLLIGGVLYTFGALAYAARRPDPAPRVFGYHEVFHACVVAACACHFVVVAEIVRGA